MRMRVIRVDTLTRAIGRLLLEPASATPLSPFTAGAHVVLHVQLQMNHPPLSTIGAAFVHLKQEKT